MGNFGSLTIEEYRFKMHPDHLKVYLADPSPCRYLLSPEKIRIAETQDCPKDLL